MAKPCTPLRSAPDASAATTPKATPPQFTAAMKIIAVAPTIAPRQKDMMFPLIVISVIPMATHPTKETVVNNDKMLGFDRKPGVVKARMPRRRTKTARIAGSRLSGVPTSHRQFSGVART